MLATTAGVRLASGTMFDLYEQVVIEMCELREVETARALMRTTPVSQTQTTHQPLGADPASAAHSLLALRRSVCAAARSVAAGAA